MEELKRIAGVAPAFFIRAAEAGRLHHKVKRLRNARIVPITARPAKGNPSSGAGGTDSPPEQFEKTASCAFTQLFIPGCSRPKLRARSSRVFAALR